MTVRLCLWLFVFGFLVGCPSAGPDYGILNGPCTPEGQCFDGLECVDNTCVEPGGGDGTTEGTGDGAVTSDAGESDGTTEGNGDGTLPEDAGFSDGSAEGSVAMDAGSEDGAMDGVVSVDSGSINGDIAEDAGASEGNSDGVEVLDSGSGDGVSSTDAGSMDGALDGNMMDAGSDGGLGNHPESPDAGTMFTCAPGDGAVACVSVDSTTAYPLTPHVSGFGTNLFHIGWQPWDDRLVAAARDLYVGTLRIPGFAYAYDWRTGHVPDEYIAQFDPEKDAFCVDDSVCASNEECVLPSGDFIYADALDGGVSPAEAADGGAPEGRCRRRCILDCAEAGFGASCNLENCPSFKHVCNATPSPGPGYGTCVGEKVLSYKSYQSNLKGKGYLKTYDYARFADRIGAKGVVDINGFTGHPDSSAAFAQDVKDKGISVKMWMLGDEPQYWTHPALQLFTDGADYAEQMYPHAQAVLGVVPDAVLALAFSDAENANHLAFDQSLATYSLDSGYSSDKYWQAINTHVFPGKRNQSMEEGMMEVNALLHFDAYERLDDYFLPVNGIPLEGDPAPVDLGFALTTSVRYTSAMLGTIFGAVYAAEFTARMSTHPRVRTMRYFSLNSQCINSMANQRTAMQKVAKSNWGTLDSQVLDYQEYITLGCVAMREVNRAINGSDTYWETQLVGGLGVPTPIEVPYEAQDVPALFAQTYRGNDGQAHMILTNRSVQDHQVTLVMDGEMIEGPLQTWHMGSSDPEFKTENPASAITMTQEIMTNPVTVPAYGVMRVAWSIENQNVPSPASFTAALPDSTPHAVDLTWAPVANATAYRIKYSVVADYFPEVVEVVAENNQAPSYRISSLGHDIDYYFTVSALMGEDEGPNAPVQMATPAQHPALVDDDFQATAALDSWGIKDGDEALWSLNVGEEGWADVAYSNPVTGMVSENSDMTDCRVGVDFKVNSWTAGARVGVTARFVDNDNYYTGYYNLNNKKFMIAKRVAGVFTIIGRSAELGKDHARNETELWFPTIPEPTEEQWQRLRLDVDGHTLRLWYNGRLVASALDHELVSGQTGVLSRRQAVSFDNFVARDFSLYGSE